MTPRMSKLASTAIIVAACGILTWTSIGCDALESSSDKTDKSVAKAVDSGAEKLRGSADQATSANADIKKALGEGEASLQAKIQANGMLYSTTWAKAQSQLRELDLQQIKISSLSWEIQLAADRIAAGNKMVQGYKGQEPTGVRNQATKEIQKVKGSDESTAWVNGQAPIPSIVQSQLTISRLKKEIANYNQQLQGILDQRTKVLADAEAVISQSNAAKGQEAVDLFRKGTDLRIRSDSLQVQATMLAAKILPLQSDLSLAESQMKVIEQAQKNLQAQSAQAESGWQEVQKQADEQKALTQKILQTGDTDASSSYPSVNALADDLGKLLADSNERRLSVEQDLNTAAEYASSASAAAVKFKGALGQSSSAPAQTELAAAVNSAIFQIRQGQVVHAMAMSKAAHYRELSMFKAAHDRLDAALKGSGLPLPASLNVSSLDASIKEAASEASKEFERAISTLSTVDGLPGVAEDSINASRAQQIITQYAWYQFAYENGQTSEATEHLHAAQSLTHQAVMNNAILPTLPEVLGPTNNSALTPATPSDEATEPQ